jgi:hypothetical protein
LLDADADRADLELLLIKLMLKDRARMHPFGGSWRQAEIRENAGVSEVTARNSCIASNSGDFR